MEGSRAETHHCQKQSQYCVPWGDAQQAHHDRGKGRSHDDEVAEADTVGEVAEPVGELLEVCREAAGSAATRS